MNLREQGGRILIPLGFLLSLHPIMSSSLALLLGISLALVFGNPHIARTRKLTRPMLAWAIVGLGAGVNLMVVYSAGTSGVLFTLGSLAAVLAAGGVLGYFLGTNRETSVLINVGTAICGGSAIAAVSAAIRARDDSTSVALGVVFILNAIGLLVFPLFGRWLEMTQAQFGWWAALAIHDTSSVVGATMQYGPEALDVGTTVKLVRALWIIPVTLLFAKFFVAADGSTVQQAGPQYPWFIAGFVLMSALVTWLEPVQPFAQHVEFLARRVLVATLFLIGSGLTVATLRKVGAKAFVHAVVLWIFVAATSLAASRWA